MWALAPSAIKHVGYVLPPLLVGPQNATGPPIAPTEIAKSNPSNMHLQTNSFSPLKSRQRISPAHFSGDHAHHNAKYLEQLLDSSLATAAVIQFSGNTLADVLTPRAYDTFKALYALAALDTPTSSTKRRGSEIPSCSTFLDIGNDCPYSSHCSPTLPNSSLAVPYTGKIHVHISFSVDYIMFFSWVRLAAAVSCLAVICLGFAKGSSWSKRPFRRQGIYIVMLTTSCVFNLVLTCINYSIINPWFAVSLISLSGVLTYVFCFQYW